MGNITVVLNRFNIPDPAVGRWPVLAQRWIDGSRVKGLAISLRLALVTLDHKAEEAGTGSHFNYRYPTLGHLARDPRA